MDHRKKQENSRKTFTSASLTTLKPLTVWITTNCGKFLKRWEYQTTLPASCETCVQLKKQQLELDMKQQTGSKLGKEYIKVVYCNPVYLTYMQSAVLCCSVVSDSLAPHGLKPARLFCPWGFSRQEYWWLAISFSRGSSQPRDQTQVSHIAGRFFTIWATREAIIGNARLDEAQAGIKIAGRNTNNLRYADDTTLIAESEEELKNYLMRWKRRVKKLA